MFEMPDAAPVSRASTDDVDADDAGPFATPRPTAISTSGATNATYVQEAPTKMTRADPSVATANPSATVRLAPILTASLVINGVTAIIAAAAGSVARPASRALYPKAAGFWK